MTERRTLLCACWVLLSLLLPKSPVVTAAVPDDGQLAVVSPDVSLHTGNAVDVEVAVVVFDHGLKAYDPRDARHALRSVETRTLAVMLRDTLTQSGRWGAVRVLPEDTRFADITITGTIEASDGSTFSLAIAAHDSAGEQWLAKTFSLKVPENAYPISGVDPYQPLFNAVANQLAETASGRSPRQLKALASLAALRYAAVLAPAAFTDYVTEQNGRWSLLRLPAESDPMLARIARVRNQEAQFIDTIDQQFRDLSERVQPIYDLWRQARYEQARYRKAYSDRARERELDARPGSFAAMQAVYGRYRSIRIQEQDAFEVAEGFDTETGETVMDTGETLVRLSGTLDTQYQQWRKLLAEIIRLERGISQ